MNTTNSILCPTCLEWKQVRKFTDCRSCGIRVCRDCAIAYFTMKKDRHYCIDCFSRRYAVGVEDDIADFTRHKA